MTGGLTLTAGAAAAAGPAALLRAARASSGDPAAARLHALETRHRARLGVYAIDHRGGATVSYRADERVAFCSVYKAPLVAHVLRERIELERVIHYTKRDLVAGDFSTGLYVDTGMTVRALCAAALAQSDNVAANLLLGLTGGPAALTRFARSLGDPVTRVDRNEPSVNTAVPGELRDTTTPRAIAADFTRLLLGSALSATDRRLLTTWMADDMVNIARFRAGLPDHWQIADKTGTGDYGVANDVGVAWTEDGTPLTIAVLTTKATRNADPDDALVAQAARIVADTLTAGRG